MPPKRTKTVEIKRVNKGNSSAKIYLRLANISLKDSIYLNSIYIESEINAGDISHMPST